MNTRRENKMSFCVGVFLFLTIAFNLRVRDSKAAQADHVLINEIQTDSIVGAGGSADDFIELYNPTDFDVDLSSWSIQKQSALLTSTIYKKELSGIIKAKGYYLIVRGDTDTDPALVDMADIVTASTFSMSSNNAFYLVNNNENIVDLVGIGTAEAFETLAASNPSESKSIQRLLLGEDTDDNSLDFEIVDLPTPESSTPTIDDTNNLSGTVLLSIAKDTNPVQNITANGAEIVFSVNDLARARVNYGLSDSYGINTSDLEVMANAEVRIALANLECATLYHYSIYAENTDASDSHSLADATFETLPCGIELHNIEMTSQSARASDDYTEGWAWRFDITVWDMTETGLKMKFAEWQGLSSISAGGNMEYSLDGINWQAVVSDDAYPDTWLDISGFDTDLDSSGRQLSIFVQMKVPVGVSPGDYSSSYGILTE